MDLAFRGVLDMEKRGASLEELREFIVGERAKKSWMEGELDLGILACGQVTGLIREVVSVQELISSMIEGGLAIHRRLSPHFSGSIYSPKPDF